MAAPLSILALEPWLGGSHRQFLERWRARSRHRVEIVGLAPRHWRWRMRSAAWELARRIERERREPPDVLFVSDYLDLVALHGWLPAAWNAIPSVVYFHENQLTYPPRPGEEPSERDLHLAFTNVHTCLRATRIAFNSGWHKDAFAKAADELCARLPRPNPRAELAETLARASVIHPGIDLEEIPLGPGGPSGAPLRAVFNHRFEHDKDPLGFLDAVAAVLARGRAIELVLLGERFEELPAGVAERLAGLEGAILWAGFAESREAYAAHLAACDVAVSTARQEFFGVAVLEALAAGCSPLLPARLAYPEILPAPLHAEGLYADGADLVERLSAAAERPDALREASRRARARAAAALYDASASAARLDDLCTAAAG